MNVQKVRYGSADSARSFAESLRETGFAVLSHHPIQSELIYDVYEDWKNFFADEAKMKYRFDPAVQDGYFPFRSENAKGYSAKDLKEFYHLYSWSRLPDSLGSKTWELFKALLSLSTELLGWIEDESPENVRNSFSMPLRNMILDSRETLLRILHYPPLSGSEEVDAVRAAAHEDINLITLLPTATAPGLQALDREGIWHEVECNPGDIVINVGDMLQLASQNYYRSTTHRVVNPRGDLAREPRYSMPLFLHARADVRLSETHTAKSYLAERLKEIGLKA